jgi:hypothetical protein
MQGGAFLTPYDTFLNAERSMEIRRTFCSDKTILSDNSF